MRNATVLTHKMNDSIVCDVYYTMYYRINETVVSDLDLGIESPNAYATIACISRHNSAFVKHHNDMFPAVTLTSRILFDRLIVTNTSTYFNTPSLFQVPNTYHPLFA